MNNSKVALAVSRMVSIIQAIAGWFFLVVFGVCTLAYLSDSEYRADAGVSFLICCLVFDAIGIILIIFSRKRSKLIKEFKKYVSYISTEPTGSIDNIAAAMGISVDVVKSNLELMIKRNYFVNAHINNETNCIIVGSNNQPKMQPSMSPQTQTVQQDSLIPITCKCCGGINKIQKGSVTECDFCGSPIKG